MAALIEVTQADREAAASLVVPHGRWPGFPSDFRSGRADVNSLTQALARHRLAHSEPRPVAGEVRVPIKPTQAMREAATEIDVDTIVAGNTRLNWEEADAIYAAMLAAAPSTQGGAEG